MLKKLTIKRYQSHNATELTFAPGINGIIGAPQSGKSAILRAFKWLAYNRPLGFRFHSDFTKNKSTEVATRLDDGSEIELSKTEAKGSGTYTFTTPKGKMVDAKAASGVPDLVTQALNLSELNIQYQLDNPFLITTSPGEIARTINRVTKAEKLDDWIREVNKRINTLTYERDARRTLLDDIKKALKPFEKLGALEKKLTALEKAREEIVDLRAERDNVEDLLANIEDLQNTIKHQERYLKAKTYLDKIEAIEEEKLDLQTEKTKITAARDLEEQLGYAIREREERVVKYINALKEEEVCPTCFNTLDARDIRRIAREIRSVK